MKNIKILPVLLFLMLSSYSLEHLSAQSMFPIYKGSIIPITSFSLSPENCAAPGNGVDRLNDGINNGDYTEFHTPWGGMPKQDVTIEGVLDGNGKTLNEIVLDQRFLGTGGVLKTGSVWVKANNKYQKIADFELMRSNDALSFKPKKPIKNPQGVKLIINDTYTDNGNYMVCLGELTCLMNEESASLLIQEIDTIKAAADKNLMKAIKQLYVQKKSGSVGPYTGNLIAIKDLTVTPAGCAAADNDVDKLVDGKNFGEKTEFHTPWKGMPRQVVAIEGNLDGAGKTLNEVVLDQRFLGTGGLIRQGSLWVMSNNAYNKVAEIQLNPQNVRIHYTLKAPIQNPQKIKLIINNTLTDNGEYMVCLGELACVSYTNEGFVRVKSDRDELLKLYADAKEKKGVQQLERTKLLNAAKYIAPYRGEVLKLSNFKTTPTNCAAPENGAELLSDSLNFGEKTEFHTPWGGMEKQVVTIEADVNGKGKRLDQIVLDQRLSGTGGLIKKGSVWVMTGGVYQKVEELDLICQNGRLFVEPEVEIRNPEKIKLVIDDTYTDNGKYMVCLGELACIMLPDSIVTSRIAKEENAFFGDLLGLTLKKDFKRSDLSKMKIGVAKTYAESLLKQNVKLKNLKVDVYPVQNPMAIATKMHVSSGFSNLEGVTGIVLKKGPNVVFVGKTNGAKLSLIQPNWLRKPPVGITPSSESWALQSDRFTLREGLNYVETSRDGLVYIQYLTEDEPEQHAPVTVYFPTGVFNGYFDLSRGDTDADFNALLDRAVFPIMDLKGKYIQAAYPVDALKKYTYNKGVRLLNGYDSIVALHRTFIGWEKQGFNPKNHILSRVNFNYFMFRDQDGIAFIDSMMFEVVDPKVIHNGNQFWGFVHETGHIFQMRPQLTWGGMVEVSNNIASMYVMTTLGNGSRLSKEQQYKAARENILDKGISYMGTFKTNPNTGYSSYSNTDVFQRLVPFWQLYLYFKQQGYPDFYADLMIAMRKQSPPQINPLTDYKNMLEFCRLACQVSGTDLTEFFQRWGFFYVGRVVVQDYSMFDYTIAQEEVDAVKKAIADMRLPKPKVDITTLED